MNRVERLVRSLGMAGPICLQLRYDYYPRCCVEASRAGAEALRRRGLQARAVRCKLVVNDNGERQWWVGASQREAYDFLVQLDPNGAPTFEQWRSSTEQSRSAAHVWTDEDDLVHSVIEVSERQRWLIDLTVSQAAFPGMPPSVAVPMLEGWPVRAGNSQFDMIWSKTSRGDDPPDFENEALVLDMLDGIRLALRVELDPNRFFSGMRDAIHRYP